MSAQGGYQKCNVCNMLFGESEQHSCAAARIATLEAELVKERTIPVCCQQWDACSGVRCVPLSEHWKDRAKALEAERDEARANNIPLTLVEHHRRDAEMANKRAEHYKARAESAESALEEARKSGERTSAALHRRAVRERTSNGFAESVCDECGATWTAYQTERHIGNCLAAIDSAIEAENGK